ncbi:hypothetical protein BDW22DRAFT_1400772 [Trametopsis cervina]|nr:hypothetical protein BDW22DRAFT_1400772 [Trametopsis cervina]
MSTATTTFHLRPISRGGNTSPSPSSSTVSDRSPPPHRDAKQPRASMSGPHTTNDSQPRRPFSSLSIRVTDLDLSVTPDMQARKYPAPPTGHELMALFPPAPPVNVGSGPTSGFFLAEERAFFAKGGNEMVRVRIEVDMPRDGDPESYVRSKHRDSAAMQRWHSDSTSPRSQTLSPQTTSPHDHIPPSLPSQHASQVRPPRSGPISVNTQPVYPIVSHTTPQTPFPAHLHSPSNGPHAPFPQHTSPQEHHHPVVAPLESDELRDDPDEAWRRPMPHSQRRRAGKHTKRVVVK